MRRVFVILLLALSLACAGTAAPPRPVPAQAATVLPKGVELVTSVEGITEYKLSNGLRILLFPDPTKATMTVNVTYLVGSGSEQYGETGMAHLLEHMVFKGSPRHKNIPQELTEHGARPNGSTWYDRTNYFETFQASDENLKWALDLEADRMVNSFIAKKDLDSEMTVVRNEFEMGENSPANVLEERLMSTAYLWHNYGHSTIGSRSDIEGVPIERLQAFYRKFYQPDNAVLLVAGKFDPAKTLDLIHSYFAPIAKPARELPRVYTQEPTQDGEREVILRRVGDVQVAMAGYHVPAGSHPDFAAVDILARVLADTPSGRLYKQLVEPKKAAAIYGFAYQLHDPGMLLFGAEVRKDGSLDQARDIMLKTIDDIVKQPPTKEEVERARQQLLKNIELNLNNSERVGLQISEWASMGDWRLLFLHRDRLQKVTLEDVQRVAGAYLKPSNRTVGLFYPVEKPERAEIPATPNVAELLKNYKGQAAVAQGEAFDASPSNVESRTHRAALGNGAKVALLSKKTRGGTVVANLVFRYGDEKSLFNRTTEGGLAGSMLMRGSANHTRQQVKDEFDRLKARVTIDGSPTYAFARIETTRENLPAVLKLAAEVLRQPAFSEKEFEELKQEELANIEQMRREPQQIAFTTYSRHMNPYPKGDVRYVPTPDEMAEMIKPATLDGVKKFYHDFYGGSNGQISVVGDFDEKEITAVLEQTLGDWKSPAPFQRVPDVYSEPAAVNETFEAPDKANAMFVAGMKVPMRDDNPDYPALVLANYMVGGGFLNSRLATRIRQKEGLSYGVGSRLSVSPLDQSATWMAYAIYAPQNRDKLEAAFKEEIARALHDGFTEEELKGAKSGWLQSQQVTRAQDASLAGKLTEYLFLPRSFKFDETVEEKVASLTAAQVSAALKKYIDLSKVSIIKAGDFAKAAAAPAAPQK